KAPAPTILKNAPTRRLEEGSGLGCMASFPAEPTSATPGYRAAPDPARPSTHPGAQRGSGVGRAARRKLCPPPRTPPGKKASGGGRGEGRGGGPPPPSEGQGKRLAGRVCRPGQPLPSSLPRLGSFWGGHPAENTGSAPTGGLTPTTPEFGWT